MEFPVVFTHTGEAKWTWHARLLGDGPQAPAWRDTVRSTLTVDHPTPRRSEVSTVRLRDGHADDLLAKVNPELLEGEEGTVQVSVSTTRLGELSEGVDDLLHYPYGCVEQTTSSLMPWLALKDFRDVLPELRHTPQQVDDAVARGVNRLMGMQTESGGLAYWPGERAAPPHPWGSAYGGLGLALAKRAGYFVPTANFNKLCTYLSGQLRSDSKAEHDTYHEHTETDKCLALYALALAGKGEPAYNEKFFARRDELSPEDRTLLALAIAESKGPADMVRALLQPGPREKESPDDLEFVRQHVRARRDAAVGVVPFPAAGPGGGRPDDPAAGWPHGARHLEHDAGQRLGGAGDGGVRARRGKTGRRPGLLRHGHARRPEPAVPDQGQAGGVQLLVPTGSGGGRQGETFRRG